MFKKESEVVIMKLVGFISGVSKNSGKEYLILHTEEEITGGRGAGVQTNSEFCDLSLVEGIDLVAMLGHDIELLYAKYGKLVAVRF